MVLAVFPAARYSAAITAPARMLLVPAGSTGRAKGSEWDAPIWWWQQEGLPGTREGLPSPFPADLPRPDPWGSLDQVCTSNPPPKFSISWAPRGFCEGNCTTWVQMKAAFSKAPENTKRKQS